MPPAGNLYLNGGNPGKRVEKPSPAVQKSLHKTGKTGEKGRESQCRLPKISTQNRKIPEKGRDSNKITKIKSRIAYDKNNRRN